MQPNIKNKVWNSLQSLLRYIEQENYRGYDPYDGLNSPINQWLPQSDKWIRIFLTQFLRHFPLNLRPILGIPKGDNPKGLGLFLTGYAKLFSCTGESEYKDKMVLICNRLINLQSRGYSGACWGFNFPWQNRYQLFPRWLPTIVNTSFIGHGFLDVYDLLRDDQYLKIAESSCDFICDDLNMVFHNNDRLCLSYTPEDNGCVYNANCLGASLLGRVHHLTGNSKFLEYAQKMIGYILNAQNQDGSWRYGTQKSQQWIDIHHTGFVLERLFDTLFFIQKPQDLEKVKKGLSYYKRKFFLSDGRPKLYHNRSYPVDTHAMQAVVTLVKLCSLEDNQLLLEQLVSWLIDHMQSKQGFFYYQKGKYITKKISYMRLSQAWAIHGLTNYYQFLKKGENESNYQTT